MKKIIVLLVMIAVSVIGFGAESIQSLDERTKIAVLPFTDLTNSRFNPGEKLNSDFVSQLSELKRFVVLDRSLLKKVVEEQKFSATMLVNREDVLRFGEISGAKLGITANIKSLSFWRNKVEKKEKEGEGLVTKIVNAIVDDNIYEKEWNAKIAVDFRLLDLETGELLKSFNIDDEYKTSGDNTEESALNGAIKKVSYTVVGGMRERVALKSYIISKNHGNVIVKMGENMGIRPGMEFLVYGKSHKIKDKVSGSEVKIEGSKTGLIVITTVNEDSANARILRGENSILEGDEVREKMMGTFDIDLSFGIAPFKILRTEQSSRYIFRVRDFYYSFDVDIKQEEKSNTPYINLEFSPGYWDIKPTLDLNVLLNSPITVFGLDLNIAVTKNMEVIEFSGSAGIGAKFASGRLGTMKVRAIDYGVYDYLFSTGSNIKNGADINLTAASFNADAKGKMVFFFNENISMFGEAGVTFAKIDSWEMSTKDVDDKEVKLGSIPISPLDMSGIFYGCGVKFRF